MEPSARHSRVCVLVNLEYQVLKFFHLYFLFVVSVDYCFDMK